MGILNVSPDSFYPGSRVKAEENLISTAEKMLSDGADFLDVGAISSRPGATLHDAKEEWTRLEPAIKLLKSKFPKALLSVDTFRAEIAEKAIEEGADIINDIGGGHFDKKMFSLMEKKDKPLILMHLRGDFESMHQSYSYQNLAVEVAFDLQKQISKAREEGVKDIIVDPGFGFSKRGTQNFELLASLSHLEILDCPLLVGISRKSMVYKTLEINPEEALNGTTALHMVALQKGAHILRVHDVKEARQCLTLFEKLCLQE